MNKRQRKKRNKKFEIALKGYLRSVSELVCKLFNEERMTYENFPKIRENIFNHV
jgi:hypothetical protein